MRNFCYAKTQTPLRYEKMKINIISDGDRSVGINSNETIVDLGIPIDDDKQREEIRKILYNTFHELHDNGNTTIIFEDECCDCFTKLINGKCQNKDCINNLYKMEV